MPRACDDEDVRIAEQRTNPAHVVARVHRLGLEHEDVERDERARCDVRASRVGLGDGRADAAAGDDNLRRVTGEKELTREIDAPPQRRPRSALMHARTEDDDRVETLLGSWTPSPSPHERERGGDPRDGDARERENEREHDAAAYRDVVTERIVPGERRARYRGTWLGPLSDEARAASATLTAALDEMESLGLAPRLDDGAVAGNGALRLPGGTWLASISARRSSEPAASEIVRFDASEFAVEYRSDDGREPTSDVALHACALFDRSGAPRAGASLHGHALETRADAARLGVVISDRAEVFGTPEDLASIAAMLDRAPYPAHRVWIRREHGFLVAAATMDEARALMRELARRR